MADASAQPTRRNQPSPDNPFVLGVAAQGRIAPAGGLIRVGAPAGIQGQPIVEELAVKVGDWVEPGQLLAVLRGRSFLQAQLDAAQRDLDSAKAAATQAETGQAQAIAELQAQITDLQNRAALANVNARRAAETSNIALDQARREEAAAKAALENARQAQPTVLAAAAAGVAVAQAQVDAVPRSRDGERKIAAAELDRTKVSQQHAALEISGQIEQLQAQADLAALKVHEAETALIVDPPPSDPAKLAPVQLEALAAHAAVTAQQNILATVQQARAADVAAARAKVASAEAQVAVARAQLALGEIRAPSAGKVLAVRARPGEVVGLSGVVELGDTREIYIDALVYIDDIPGVHVGQKTIVTGYALPTTGILGEVVEISPEVTGNSLPSLDPTEFSDQAVVVVKVRLTDPGAATNLINGQVKVRFEQ